MSEGVNLTPQAAVDTPLIKADTKKKEKTKMATRKPLEEDNLEESMFVEEGDTYFDKIQALTSTIPSVTSVDLDENGVVIIETTSKDDIDNLADTIDRMDEIESVEVDVVLGSDEVETEEYDGGELEEIDLDDIEDDGNTLYYLYCFPYDEFAIYDASIETEEEIQEALNKARYDESELYEDFTRLDEVKRKWKVNAKGKRRIKMKCKPGFKWTGKACEKISGSELSKKRRATVKMVRNKRAQGDKLKRRVVRLTRKAKRYRKSFGLKNVNTN